MHLDKGRHQQAPIWRRCTYRWTITISEVATPVLVLVLVLDTEGEGHYKRRRLLHSLIWRHSSETGTRKGRGRKQQIVGWSTVLDLTIRTMDRGGILASGQVGSVGWLRGCLSRSRGRGERWIVRLRWWIGLGRGSPESGCMWSVPLLRIARRDGVPNNA
jgi:hypothetical protein